ncbi:MAG: TolC family protein [Candidatus Melainabacteria bacterium]|nr:TolC family protein [Candidatus Melainabacteria bacterium]
MKLTVKQSSSLALAFAITMTNGSAEAQVLQPKGPELRQPITLSSPASAMSLTQVEQLAIQTNPTLVQAESIIRAAEGRRKQAGLLPNPVVGGEVENFAFRALNQKPTYLGFVVQTIPLGGKLKKMRDVYGAEVAQAVIESESQKQRVVNTIRALFYRVLGAQEMLDLQTELATLARDATGTTSELFNVGQADKPDYLESSIDKELVEHELVATRNRYHQTWRTLAVLLGTPEMAPVRLSGNLEDRLGPIDEAQLYKRLIEQSPQMKAAQAQIRRARAVAIRAKAEPMPDLFVRGAMGYSTEFLDTGDAGKPPRTGVLANAQVGITLPIFNRNPGGIASAQSELLIAEREIDRLKMQLRIQLADAVRDYNTALDAVTRYRNVILPRADEAYQLQKTKFAQMAAAYPQVLIAKRTSYQVRQKYISSLVRLQQGSTHLDGFLLSGGLDVPRMQFEHGELTGLQGTMASEEGDISSLDENHNVDHY